MAEVTLLTPLLKGATLAFFCLFVCRYPEEWVTSVKHLSSRKQQLGTVSVAISDTGDSFRETKQGKKKKNAEYRQLHVYFIRM